MSLQLIVLSLKMFTVAPEIILSSNEVLAVGKQDVSIACSASGQPHPIVTWSKAFGTLPMDRTKAIDGTLTIYNVTKKDRGTYICRAVNILGSVADIVQLVIFSRPRFKARPPKEMTPMVGSTVHLPCVVESDLKTTISWTKHGRSSLPAGSNVLQNGTLVMNSIKKSHEGSYTCRAANALTAIETKVKISIPIKETSCSVIRKNLNNASGNYVIDPDDEGPLSPFTVYCDMSDKDGVGVTVISHDTERRTRVKGTNNYVRDIHYAGASLSQLASLTKVSSNCEQFIQYECHNSFMTGHGWWVSRDSTQMNYWGGASPGSGKCACGMTNSCADSWLSCNCDKNDNVWREDSGILTDKNHLPVRQMRFSDTTGTFEEGYHTLGKLKCYGIA